MSRIDLPTNIPRRKPPLRKRFVQAIGWLGFVGGGLVTPRLAAKAAAALWCKLPNNSGRRKDNRPWTGRVTRLAGPHGSDLAVETWEPRSSPAADAARPAADAAQPAADAARPEAKTVLLVHGWGGWRGQVAAFVAPLTRDGFRVVAFDALSHGDSGPGEHGASHSSGGELMRSLEAVARGIGQPFGVIAHSLGCAAACRSHLLGNLSFEKLTLVSPSPDMREVARAFARKLGFGKRAERMLTEEMEKRAHGKLADFDIADMGATGSLPDALVIHDAADKESPYHVARDIAACWPGARLVTTEGLGHHRILIDPAVVEAAAANMLN
ncbi:MAG: alpha/beta hydrolase [Bifidobacteriaceae bacterium]|jgi:pimeloyl-ACP methyl ester carboxylesterase|nr:alpha/beta hydrolase [Bifidobacteriaceae bacterium]